MQINGNYAHVLHIILWQYVLCLISRQPTAAAIKLIKYVSVVNLYMTY